MFYRAAVRLPGTNINWTTDPTTIEFRARAWKELVFDYDFDCWIETSVDGTIWTVEDE